MHELKLLLESPDAERLASELAEQFPVETPVEVRKLRSRSPEALAVVSIGLDTLGAVGGLVTLADILIDWLAKPEIGKLNVQASLDGADYILRNVSRERLIEILGGSSGG